MNLDDLNVQELTAGEAAETAGGYVNVHFFYKFNETVESWINSLPEAPN